MKVNELNLQNICFRIQYVMCYLLSITICLGLWCSRLTGLRRNNLARRGLQSRWQNQQKGAHNDTISNLKAQSRRRLLCLSDIIHYHVKVANYHKIIAQCLRKYIGILYVLMLDCCNTKFLQILQYYILFLRSIFSS